MPTFTAPIALLSLLAAACVDPPLPAPPAEPTPTDPMLVPAPRPDPALAPAPRPGADVVDPQAAIDRAQTLWSEGEQAQAEAALLAVLAAHQDQPGFASEWALRQARDKLGRLYLEQRRYDEARQVLELSAQGLEAFNQEHALGWACPYQALGALYAATDQPAQALALQIKAADTESGSARAQLDVAILALSAGDGATSVRFLDRAEALLASPGQGDAAVLQPSQLPVIRGFAQLLMRDHQGAEALFESAGDSSSTAAGAAAGLGHVAIAARDYGKAQELLAKAVRMSAAELDDASPSQDPMGLVSDPKRLYLEASFQMACLGSAWIESNHGRHREAMAWYERILEQNPSHLLALLGKGNALVGLGSPDQAEALFERALERYPDNPYVLAELGLIRFHQDDVEAAERLFERALSLDDGRYTCPHEGLGLVYLRQGRTEQARASFQRAIDLNPDIEFAKYNGLARIYIDEGREDLARELLLKSLANYPYNGEALELLVSLGGAPPQAEP